MDGKQSVLAAFSCLMTSSGCSNMLSERRYCFLGRTKGLDIFRECWLSGEAFRELLHRLKGWRGRAGGRTGRAIGEAVRSETGDEPSKISDRANDDVGFDLGTAAPNLKEGSCASGLGLVGTEVVLKPFVLDKPGLSGLLLLLSCGI